MLAFLGPAKHDLVGGILGMATFNGTNGADRIRTVAAGGSTNGVQNASPNGGDIIFAGDGNDTVEPGFGWNTVFAQNGDDVIVLQSFGNAYGEFGNDTITLLQNGLAFGGSGNDSLAGTGNFYVELFGHGGNDTISAGNAGSEMDGGSDNDLILGGMGNDNAAGSFGADTILGSGGDD